MPSLEEMRKWLEGDQVEALPEREMPTEPAEKPKGKPMVRKFSDVWSEDNVEKMLEGAEESVEAEEGRVLRLRELAAWNPSHSHGELDGDWLKRARYDIKADGTDARLKFGSHRDELLSEMAADVDGLGYMRWMAEEGKFDRPGEDDLMIVVRSFIYPMSPEAEELEKRRRLALAFGPPMTPVELKRKPSRESSAAIKARKERVRKTMKKASPRVESVRPGFVVKGDGTIVENTPSGKKCDYCENPATVSWRGGGKTCSDGPCHDLGEQASIRKDAMDDSVDRFADHGMTCEFCDEPVKYHHECGISTCDSGGCMVRAKHRQMRSRA